MAYIYRLIFLFLISFNALADNSYIPPLITAVRSNLGGSGDLSTPEAVCDAALQPVNTANYTGTVKAISVKTCQLQTTVYTDSPNGQYFDIYSTYYLNNGTVGSNWLVGKRSQNCLVNEGRTGTIPSVSCTPVACTSPKTYYDVTTNTCILPPTCTAGDGPSGYLSTSSCLAGCTHTWSGQTATIGTTKYGMYLGKTGGTCTLSVAGLMNKGDVDAAMAKADADAVAAAATAKAAADAKAAAAKADADAKAKLAKAAADAAAKAEADAKTAADKAAADAADASKTQEEKDASAAASAAAKTAADAAKADAATKAGAAAGAALPSPDATPEFCALHPASIICKNSSVVAGSCSGGVSSGFSCSGDAIQCQIAKEQQAANCKFYDVDEALKTEYTTLTTGISNNPADTANRQGVNIQDSLTVSHPASGSCPVDKTFIVNGHSFVLELSTYCPYLEFLGNVILILAYLGAAKIIGGSV